MGRMTARGAVILGAVLLAPCGAGCSHGVTGPDAGASTWDREHAACLQRAVFGNPADSAYVLPYPVGAAYVVSSTYCYAGNAHYNELAYDFVMPVGAEIVASRAGTVEGVVDHFEDGTSDNTRSNSIAIRHDDGTVAGYGHTQQWGAVVRVGDRVDQGQVIGHAGSSGAGGLPHLHLGVFPRVVWRRQDDLAFNFRNAQGPLDERGGLVNGALYAALPFAP